MTQVEEAKARAAAHRLTVSADVLARTDALLAEFRAIAHAHARTLLGDATVMSLAEFEASTPPAKYVHPHKPARRVA